MFQLHVGTTTASSMRRLPSKTCTQVNMSHSSVCREEILFVCRVATMCELRSESVPRTLRCPEQPAVMTGGGSG